MINKIKRFSPFFFLHFFFIENEIINIYSLHKTKTIIITNTFI